MAVFLTILVIFIVAWLLVHSLRLPALDTFNLYFGPPGCGKTMFLAKIAYRYHKKNTVFSNFSILLDGVFKFKKADLGSYSFPEGSILLFDEGSLNGFDNRNFKSNFKDQGILDYLKKLRHYRNKIVFSNQGWDELDLKIRTLTRNYFLVKKLPLFSIAFRVRANVGVDKETKQIIDSYKMPNLLSILFSPDSCYLVFRPKYGKLYNSWERSDLPSIIKERWYDNENVS